MKYKAILEISSSIDELPLPIKKLRMFSRGQTLKKVWPLRNKLGITRLTDLTDLDYVGIPVVSATRPSVKTEQITATQGKGIKKIDAIISALMEAVERHACANYVKTFVKTYNSADEKYLIPNVENIAEWDGKRIEWVEATHIRTNQKKFLPAADVLFPYYAPNDTIRPVRPSTTGIASGNTLIEALIQSIFEVAERDATSSFVLNGYRGSLLNLETVSSPEEKFLLNKFMDKRIDINIYDLSHLSPFAVYYSSILNQEGLGPPLACAGQSAHIIPEIALRKSLTEAAQSRIVALQGSREDLIRHDNQWKGHYNFFCEMRKKVKETALRNCGTVEFKKAVKNYFCQKDFLIDVLDQLDSKGYRDLYFVDLTHEIGIPVVFTSVIGMVDNVVDSSRIRAQKDTSNNKRGS